MNAVKLVVTTTHRSNPRVRSLAKELSLSLPSAVKVNRGKMSYQELFEYAKSLGASRVLVVCRGLKGNPGRLLFLDITGEDLRFYPLVLKLRGVRLAREMGVKPFPPKNLAVVAPDEPDVVDVGQELAGALDLVFIEGTPPESLAEMYESVLYVEPIRSPKAAFALKFLEPSTGNIRGPRLLVERCYMTVPRIWSGSTRE